MVRSYRRAARTTRRAYVVASAVTADTTSKRKKKKRRYAQTRTTKAYESDLYNDHTASCRTFLNQTANVQLQSQYTQIKQHMQCTTASKQSHACYILVTRTQHMVYTYEVQIFQFLDIDTAGSKEKHATY